MTKAESKFLYECRILAKLWHFRFVGLLALCDKNFRSTFRKLYTLHHRNAKRALKDVSREHELGTTKPAPSVPWKAAQMWPDKPWLVHPVGYSLEFPAQKMQELARARLEALRKEHCK
jgi:hypothetical protein